MINTMINKKLNTEEQAMVTGGKNRKLHVRHPEELRNKVVGFFNSVADVLKDVVSPVITLID